MSKIQIINRDDECVVSIDMHDGSVEVSRPDQLDEAARTFWQSVATLRRHAPDSGDLVFREPDARKVVVRPGPAPEGGHGGNINIFPGPGDVTVQRHTDDASAAEES